MDALATGESATAGSLAQPVDPIPLDSPIGPLLQRLDHGEDAVPVADETGALAGWVRQRDMLASLSLSPS